MPNPAFEFDGCFDPHGSNKPTGVNLNPKTPAPTTPAALAIGAAALRPDKNGLIRPALTCSPGQEGCGGTITATLNGQPLQTATYALAPGNNGDIQFQLSPRQATHGGKLLLTPTPVIGDAARAKTTLASQTHVGPPTRPDIRALREGEGVCGGFSERNTRRGVGADLAVVRTP